MKNQYTKHQIHNKKITKRKKQNEKLQEVTQYLEGVGQIKMTLKTLKRLESCGDFLQFLSDKNLESFKLCNGIFCKNRFCPICSKNKAVKDACEIKLMTDFVLKELNRQLIFVTFTAPNVIGEELGFEIEKFNKAFNHFIKLKKYKKVLKGTIRKLEVTYNNNKKSKNYDTYHPHLHILISVNKSYFQGGMYIKRDDWLKDWQSVMKDYTITQVDVRRLQIGNTQMLDKGILELTKYIAKDSNFLENEKVFLNFYRGLKGKRQYGYGGDFNIARQKLKAGELDKYKKEDDKEWYYLLTNKWDYKTKTYNEILEEIKKEN